MLMRILHTSDWHLGQNFFGKSRANEHQAFMDWILEQVDTQSIDVIIIAGDIFDTASPPSYARELYNQFIVNLQQTPCQLIILGGNHDSVAMLNESKSLFACLNTQVIASVCDSVNEQVIVLKTQSGDAGAILCAIPFIRTRDVVISQSNQSATDKQQAMQAGITQHYQTIYQQAVKLAEQYTPPLPIIATGHLTAVGASTSDSVREIYIGTLDAFPASAFPPADYIALGHIHQAQVVAKKEHIRYSGSPIPLSFDETNTKHPKSVCMVDVNKGMPVTIKLLNIPIFQPMTIIKGDLKSIEKQLNALPDHYRISKTHPIWVEIRIASQDYLSNTQSYLQTISRQLPVDILLVRREPSAINESITDTKKITLNELTPSCVFDLRLKYESADNKTDKAQIKRLKNHFEQLVIDLESD